MVLHLILESMYMTLIDTIKNYYPEYELQLPISKKKILFTPFRVKDAKNIGIILQENNKKLALNALYEVLKNNTKNANIDTLDLYEAEYIFLHIRSKSIDEVINVIYDNEKYAINIFDIRCDPGKVEKYIKINDQITIELEFPKLKSLLNLNSLDKKDIEKSCIKKVILKNEIFDVNVFVPQEIEELIDNLPISFSKQIESFLLNQPKLYYKFVLNNGTEKEVSGLLDFFTFR